jgi:hypothetical protein
MNCLFSLLLTASVVTASEPKADFAFHETGPAGIQLSDGGRPVFVYNFGLVSSPVKGAVARSCYLHPVYAPNGVLLSDDFNPDHPHHRGISWMWPEVTVDGRKGDLWMVKGFQQRFVRWQARETAGPTAKLAVENGWFDGDRKFVKEDVEIIVHGVEQSKGGDAQRQLDFTLRFEALDKPVEIVGTSEGKKGFGGFCFRFAPRDGGTAKTVIRTEKGLSPKDAVLGKHRWAEVAGTFHGQPAWGRIDDLEGNPGFPHNGWLLRHGFGFLNVSYPGLTPLVLQPGKPLELKYRVTLGAGEGKSAGSSD